jgi:hypothetical protein
VPERKPGFFVQIIVTTAIKPVNCHAGFDPASSRFWISAFAGMTALTYIVAGVISGLKILKPSL